MVFTINRPIYQLLPHGVNKDGRLVIDLFKAGRREDTICEVTLPTNMAQLQDPNLLIYVLRWLRWYLPDNLPQCEWIGLRIQLICIKNNIINSLCQSKLSE
jgi:hypothetical protein